MIDEASFIICVTILIILFIGEPDLHDSIISLIGRLK